MTRTRDDLDRKWRLVARTILAIGRPCTIYEIACHIEKMPLTKEAWEVGNWRNYAHGSERNGYIKIKRNCRPFIYSVHEYGFNRDAT